MHRRSLVIAAMIVATTSLFVACDENAGSEETGAPKDITLLPPQPKRIAIEAFGKVHTVTITNDEFPEDFVKPKEPAAESKTAKSALAKKIESTGLTAKGSISLPPPKAGEGAGTTDGGTATDTAQKTVDGAYRVVEPLAFQGDLVVGGTVHDLLGYTGVGELVLREDDNSNQAFGGGAVSTFPSSRVVAWLPPANIKDAVPILQNREDSTKFLYDPRSHRMVFHEIVNGVPMWKRRSLDGEEAEIKFPEGVTYVETSPQLIGGGYVIFINKSNVDGSAGYFVVNLVDGSLKTLCESGCSGPSFGHAALAEHPSGTMYIIHGNADRHLILSSADLSQQFDIASPGPDDVITSYFDSEFIPSGQLVYNRRFQEKVDNPNAFVPETRDLTTVSTYDVVAKVAAVVGEFRDALPSAVVNGPIYETRYDFTGFVHEGRSLMQGASVRFDEKHLDGEAVKWSIAWKETDGKMTEIATGNYETVLAYYWPQSNRVVVSITKDVSQVAILDGTSGEVLQVLDRSIIIGDALLKDAAWPFLLIQTETEKSGEREISLLGAHQRTPTSLGKLQGNVKLAFAVAQTVLKEGEVITRPSDATLPPDLVLSSEKGSYESADGQPVKFSVKVQSGLGAGPFEIKCDKVDLLSVTPNDDGNLTTDDLGGALEATIELETKIASGEGTCTIVASDKYGKRQKKLSLGVKFVAVAPPPPPPPAGVQIQPLGWQVAQGLAAIEINKADAILRLYLPNTTTSPAIAVLGSTKKPTFACENATITLNLFNKKTVGCPANAACWSAIMQFEKATFPESDTCYFVVDEASLPVTVTKQLKLIL